MMQKNKLLQYYSQLKETKKIMSCGLLLCSNDHIVMAADTLLTFVYENGVFHKHKDGYKKIIPVAGTDIVVMGVGLGDFREDYAASGSYKTLSDIVGECSGKDTQSFGDELGMKLSQYCRLGRAVDYVVAGIENNGICWRHYVCANNTYMLFEDSEDSNKKVMLLGALWVDRLQYGLSVYDTIVENIKLADDILTAAALLDEHYGEYVTIGKKHDIFVIDNDGVRQL